MREDFFVDMACKTSIPDSMFLRACRIAPYDTEARIVEPPRLSAVKPMPVFVEYGVPLLAASALALFLALAIAVFYGG